MDNSEDQFQTLAANLIVRVNHALKETNKMDAIGLLLFQDDTVQPFISIIEGNVGEAINILQANLIPVVKEKRPVAGCLAYPNYTDEEVVAYLENNEHYIAKYRIPVLSNPELHLDMENIEIEDGEIILFGE